MPRIRRALISVSDKNGLEPLARGLAERGVEIVSSGGTAKSLESAGVSVVPVSAVTRFPEILGGRVKTLHPKIHGGILADLAQEEHLADLGEHGIPTFELVVVNLYPFRQTVARPEATEAAAVESIDIGGPAMIRAAAKNFAHVTVVVDPADYQRLLEAIAADGGASPELRRELAAKAFAHTAGYDRAIADWFARGAGGEPFPQRLELALDKVLAPRYGENPHQGAAVYATSGAAGVFGGFEQLQGKELSYNNLLDADAARKLVALFDEPAVVIVKHGNPCGVGRGRDLVEAYRRAFECDPVSAFGSIIATNAPASGALAEAMAELFVEVVIAPGFEAAARERYRAKSALRLLACPLYAPGPAEIELRGVDGGFLAQQPDAAAVDPGTWTCPTARQPSAEELDSLLFAWKVCRYVKSNAIVVADRHATLGVGAGQMSRVDSCRLAIEKAERSVVRAVAASDAFFPFRDGLDVLARAGISAVVQPGGSKRDAEVVAAADEQGLAMMMTGVRHFRH
ncbi:MAG TPA: bifunctional phosphoribosylaminoimidazolecarboxamide formyltransferase/IMP cyclohydrolase [Thermoanaerobaculia bacterium]|nr:bifunctional phosphoribosylaminoimidazolecarboxamide formyltransferase/IMP cyclohydrolase [Thermoanaerobaculia bacterium]